MYNFSEKLRSNKNKIFWGSILVFVIIRTLMQNSTPLYGIGSTIQDDMLMVNYAKSILEGNWLGQYGLYTLNKMPAYSLFLAFCFKVNLPYQIALGLLYSTACIVFVKAFRKTINNDFLMFLAFLFLLFSPIMFHTYIGKRIYRLAIIPAEVILLFSGVSALYFKRNESLSTIIKWSFLSCISLIAIYFTREDSLWVILFVTVATTCILISLIADLFFKDRKVFLKKVVIVIAPLAMLFLSTNCYKLMNKKIYGIFAENDFSGTYFSKVSKDLSVIDSGYEKDGVTVTHGAVKMAYEVSPTFATLKDTIENYLYNSVWQTNGIYGDDDEIEKDYFIWGLREVVAYNGHYTDANETNNFYKKIHEELTDAFENGKLIKKKGIVISSLVRPFRFEDLPDILQCWSESIIHTVDYSKCLETFSKSTNPVENLRIMETITDGSIIYPDKESVVGNGWVFLKNGRPAELKLNLGDKVITLKRLTSDDVYMFFKNTNENVSDSLKQCRFSFDEEIIENIDNVKILIYDGENLVDSIALKGSDINKDTEQYKIYFDSFRIGNNVDKAYTLYEDSIKNMNKIGILYNKIGVFLSIIGALCYLIITVFIIIYKSIRNKLFEIWLVLTGILMSFLLLEGTVSYAYTIAWNRQYRFQYLAGAYTLSQMFIMVSISMVIYLVYNKRGEFK